MKLYPATITERRNTTDDALTLTLSVPSDCYSMFNYQAGQHITVAVKVDGKLLRRSYSLNSSPALDEDIQITVKRVTNGRVSNHIHDHYTVGDTLHISPPIGSFKPDISKNNHKSYYLFAAGSGITPIWSIAKTILAVEPWSYVYLLYGNKNEESIIFEKAIKNHESDYPERLFVQHILSNPISHQWKALFKNIGNWQGLKGRIDTNTIENFINTYPPQAQKAQYFVCGPGNMIPQVRNTLLSLDVADNDILFEYFGAPEDLSSQKINSVKAELTVQLDGVSKHVQVEENQTLLDAILDNDIAAPYSCQSGVCGQCKTRLTEGKVHMKSNMILNEKELKQGDILACQSYATTDSVGIKYE